MFAAEPLPRTTKAAYDFVGREQDPVLVYDPLDLRPVRVRGNHEPSRPLHRFADERGDPVGSDFQDLGLELTRALQAEFVRREIATLTEPVGLVDVHDAGNPAVRAELFMHRLHSAERRARDRAAVI